MLGGLHAVPTGRKPGWALTQDCAALVLGYYPPVPPGRWIICRAVTRDCAALVLELLSLLPPGENAVTVAFRSGEDPLTVSSAVGLLSRQPVRMETGAGRGMGRPF